MTQLEILQAARLGYVGKLAEVDRLIAVQTGEATPAIEEAVSIEKRHKFSAAVRAKMAKAQRERWAKLKGEEPAAVVEPIAKPRKKRKLSVAGRKRIAEATRKRWAEYNAAKKRAAA